MEKIFITGGTGLIGSRIVELLKDSHSFLQITRGDGFDISDKSSLEKIKDEAKYLIHLAAKADVDGCEQEKDLGEASEAWRVNVIGTQNVADFCRERGIKMIYISTDFVFDGNKKEGDFYTEEDAPSPINFYGKTKYEGEKVVQKSGASYAVLRIAYPYRKEFSEKGDFVRNIVKLLQNGTKITGVMDQIICPTFIDDIATSIKLVMHQDKNGIYHSVGGSPVTPFDAINKIAQVFGLDKSLITPTTREEFYAGKAARPFNLFLKNGKIQQLGFSPNTFEEGLEHIK